MYFKFNKKFSTINFIASEFTVFVPKGSNSHMGAPTKAAKGRARKALGEIKKLVTDYRKASVTEGKA